MFPEIKNILNEYYSIIFPPAQWLQQYMANSQNMNISIKPKAVPTIRNKTKPLTVATQAYRLQTGDAIELSNYKSLLFKSPQDQTISDTIQISFFKLRIWNNVLKTTFKNIKEAQDIIRTLTSMTKFLDVEWPLLLISKQTTCQICSRTDNTGKKSQILKET